MTRFASATPAGKAAILALSATLLLMLWAILTVLGTLVGASQSSTGALQAAQAGNQLLALQSQQIADLTALLAAQGRAQALEAARDAAAEEEGRVRFNRFMARSGGTD